MARYPHGGTLPCVISLPILFYSGIALGQTISEKASSKEFSALSTRLKENIPQFQKTYRVPGIVIGLIQGGGITEKHALGMADQKKKEKVTSETVFNVASVSKSVTAWGAMRLVEQGKLDLDAPVTKYLMRWKLPTSEFDHNDFTLRRLLSHTAGVSYNEYFGVVISEIKPKLETLLSDISIVSQPGTQYSYSNANYVLIQLLIEEITGQSFANFMSKEVLIPLSMNRSSYGGSSAIAMSYDSMGKPISRRKFTALGPQGLETTLDDLVSFVLANMDSCHRVLKQKIVESMRAPIDPSDSYGMGIITFSMGEELFATHSGSRWASQYIYSPESRNGLVVLSNSVNGSYVGRAILCEWLEMQSTIPCDAKPELPIDIILEEKRLITGQYRIRSENVFDIQLSQDVLRINWGEERVFLLHARSANEFYMIENNLTIRFEFGELGVITSMQFRFGNAPWEHGETLANLE